jgi:dUTP pyrophosphatase
MSYFLDTFSHDSTSGTSATSETTDPSLKTRFLNAMYKKCDRCMILRIFVNGSVALQDQYEHASLAHNSTLIYQEYVDSGFDLFSPEETKCTIGDVVKVNFNIQCSSYMVIFNAPNATGNGNREFPTGYYLYPRSSLSKTSLRLGNSVGIIDSGYRGNVIGMFDCVNSDYVVKPLDRLVQICAPSLVPIFVEIVRNVEELGMTSRGSGGFGSSGR